MADRDFEIKITTRLDVDEASARRVREAVAGIGRDIGGRLGEADKATRRLSDGIKILDANISPGRLIGWAVGWSSAYRALNLVTGAVHDAFAATLDLDRQLHNVNAIAKLSSDQLAAVKDQIRAMSTDARAGFRPMSELAAALYSINSAGIVGAQSVDVLRASAAAAKAGLTDTGTAAGALIAVLNAYGLSAKDAARVSDVLFKTVEVGVPPFSELAGHIGEIAATAAVAGVSVEELGLVWAATSRVLSNASLTSTGLARVITSFLNPSEALRRTIRGLGFDSGAVMLQQLGLVESLRKLHTVTGDDATVLRALFTDVRAFRTVAVLLSNDMQVLTKAQADWGRVGQETGSTQKALTEQLKSQVSEVERLRAEWQRLSEESAATAIPTLARLVKLAADFLELRRQGGGFGVLGAGLGARQDLLEQMRRRAVMQAFAQTPAEVLRRRPPTLAPEEPGAAPPLSLEELTRLFERHKALGEFTTGGEIQALGKILIPAVEQQLEAARKIAENQAEVERLESQLVQLEGRRVELARNLADEFLQAARAVERSFEAVRRADVAAAEAGLRGVTQQLDLSIAPLERFRDLMGDALDPRRAKELREEIQGLSLQRINAEADTLRRLMETARTPEERVGFAQRLQDVLGRRAEMLSRFAIENRQAATQQADALRSLIGQYDPTDPTRRTLEFRLADIQRGAGRATEEAITKPYRDAAQAIAQIQHEVIDPALRASQDEARKIADAMLERIQGLEGGIVDAFGTIGKAAGRVFVAELGRELGDLAGNLTRSLIENLERELRNRQQPGGSLPGGSSLMSLPRAASGGGNVYVSMNGVDLTSALSDSAKAELAAAVVGSVGDRAAAREWRLAGAGPVA